MRDHVLESDHLRLTLLPGFGCHWRSLRAKGSAGERELLHTPTDLAELIRQPLSFGCFVLAPWSNRISGASFEVDGERHELHPSFPDGTAIHGDVRERPWNVRRAGASELHADLDTRDFADFNYPFAMRFLLQLELDGDELSARVLAENLEERVVPLGLGFHPYFRRALDGGTEASEDVRLTVPAERVYPSIGCIPTGPAQQVAGRTDLRRGDPLAGRELDDCFTDLTGPVRLDYPASDVSLEMRPDPGFDHLVVYTSAEARFVAVEPVSHVTDGFNLAARSWRRTGVTFLPPGGRWGGGFRLKAAPG